jgi:5'(3')-deoxyribonucleotidase
VIVLFDCDGVVSDFTSAWLRLARDMFGISATEEDVTQYCIEDALGVSLDQAAAIYERLLEPGFAFERIEKYPDANALHDLLADSRFDCYFVTSPMRSYEVGRRCTWTHDREHWLHNEFGVQGKRVIHASTKHIVFGDVLVEDSVANLERWMRFWYDENDGAVGWLIDRPWNRDWQIPERWRECVMRGTLPEFAAWLRDFKR